MVRNAHRSRRRVFTALATATAITLAIGACGGDDDDAGAPDDAPDPTSAPAATDPPTSEPDSDEPDTDEPATSEPTSPDAGAGSAELDELIAAAQAEEKIVFYGVANEETLEVAGQSFTDTYGIPYEYVRLTTPDTAARLTAEAQAQAVVADVTLITATEIFPALIESGVLVPFDDAIPGWRDMLPEPIDDAFVKDDWGTAIPVTRPGVIAYNTDLVSPDEAPQTLEDLLDPRWKGELMITDPSQSGSYVNTFYQMYEVYGPEFVEQMGQQDIQWAPSALPSAQALAAGEVSIVFGTPLLSFTALKDEGAPIDWVIPDVTKGSDTVIGIVADSPHPNAAKLFAYHMMTREGSASLLDPFYPLDITPYEGELPSTYETRGPADFDEAIVAEIFEMLGLG